MTDEYYGYSEEMIKADREFEQWRKTQLDKQQAARDEIEARRRERQERGSGGGGSGGLSSIFSSLARMLEENRAEREAAWQDEGNRLAGRNAAFVAKEKEFARLHPGYEPATITSEYNDWLIEDQRRRGNA